MTNLRKALSAIIFSAMMSLLLFILFGDNGLLELRRMRSTHSQLLMANHKLVLENVQMYRTVERLQKDAAFIENVARQELGMIRSDELIFKFIYDSESRQP